MLAPEHGIWGFRDPAYFRDPATGSEHLLFAGSAGWTADPLDGVIGLAARTTVGWQLRPPLAEAIGVNSELERPHMVLRDSRYYCFGRPTGRHARGLDAPTGLYGIVASQLSGPWRPLNGSGLIVANPVDAPVQAYCWWVTAEGRAISFIDYAGVRGMEPPQSQEARRATFGGMAAPFIELAFNDDVVLPQSSTLRVVAESDR